MPEGMKPFSEILNDIVPVMARDWPDGTLDELPGDLSKFMPQGFGAGPPRIRMPWGFVGQGSYYGFDAASAHPMQGAPSTAAEGGVIYFNPYAKRESLESALEVMGVRLNMKTFAVYCASSEDVKADHYLDQVRIVNDEALRLFGVTPFGINRLHPPSPITLADLVWRFVEIQTKRWDGNLTGIFGGDGDWAKDWLSFGFMVENTYWSIYRLWSRPWLATK
jgi:hypothetical protein